MAYRASARRYAQAAFEIALEKGDLDDWLEDLGTIGTAIDTEGLGEVLDSPQLTTERKVAVIDEAFGDSVRPLPRNLLCLLASKNLSGISPEVANEFAGMVDSHRGVERAEVVTAFPMDETQSDKLSELLREIAGRDVVITARIDSEILGGVVAKVGDRVIDGSAKTRLESLRKTLTQGR